MITMMIMLMLLLMVMMVSIMTMTMIVDDAGKGEVAPAATDTHTTIHPVCISCHEEPS